MISSKVIAVDLDGTLTFTDTLYEGVLNLIRTKPFMLFLLPIWYAKGATYLKLKVAENSVLDVTTLPYNVPFINWLKEQKKSGKVIVLCTAANELVAHNVSKHFDFFDDVIASDKYINLKSINKRKALEAKYGEHGYDYAGNSSADVEVWAGASKAIVVNANAKVLSKASQVASVSKTFASESPSLSIWLIALRLHHWLKNLLLFLPLLAAHQFSNFQSLSNATIAFFAFSLCASSVYITNDLLDLESDRAHLRKKNRPFATAKLSIAFGIVVVPLLIGASIAIGKFLGSDFLFVLLVYLLLTLIYTLVLKRVVLVDCLVLATLYTIRIIAGAVAVSVTLSFWLLAFSVFIFLSLALLKRYAELKVQMQEGKSTAHGRGYMVSDASLLQTFGISSGYISALVLTLYVRSEDVVSLYAKPLAIWLVIPILLFWVSWVWLKAARGEMDDDPIVFATKDKTSLVLAALIVAAFVYAATGMSF
ncbi:UbiA family prenyltransferase [Candidatus Pelagibacter sp.]|nr:UbiA family prenyltransferase [Candidatus Pelagibacter sp.]